VARRGGDREWGGEEVGQRCGIRSNRGRRCRRVASVTREWDGKGGGDVEAEEAGVAGAKDVRDEGESASRPPSGFWMSDDKQLED
jgi:hypothetical protein